MNLVRSIRLWGRELYDSMYCKDWEDIKCLGGDSSWHILTRNLDRDSVVYSAGVGKDISFEKALVSRFGVNVELFDPSPTAAQTMARDENKIANIHFHPIGFAGKSGVIKFAPPEMEHEGSFRVPGANDATVEFQCRDLSSLMQERGHTKIDLLKMDIEGFEYEVIEDVLRKSLDIRQLCVEFHHFMAGIDRRATKSAIAKLKAAGYVLIYKTRFDYTFVKS